MSPFGRLPFILPLCLDPLRISIWLLADFFVRRLGHSKVGITLDLYSHVMPGMQEDAVARVDGALQAAIQSRRDKIG